jgi:hypothetical protein
MKVVIMKQSYIIHMTHGMDYVEILSKSKREFNSMLIRRIAKFSQ